MRAPLLVGPDLHGSAAVLWVPSYGHLEARRGPSARSGAIGVGLKQVQLRVFGQVQGGFFRASAQREAKRLGLTGWVKNRKDCSVELVAEGEEEGIRDFVAWAHRGPSTARVDKVDLRWRSFDGEFFDFRILD